MINSTNLSGRFALDVKDMNELRQAAKQESPEALKATAKQFEALFMNMVMKSMRQATPQDSPFDSEQSRMYTSMLDQQLSQSLASRGVGLADVLVRQLSRTPQPAPDKEAAAANAVEAVKSGKPASETAAPVADTVRPRTSKSAHVRAFQERFAAHAEAASRATGVPAKFMLGQAALESGWGKREIRGADGTNSHNLFGIKATGGWKGKVVEVATTEYVNGVPQTRIAKFRAYDSYADAFRDYARLLKNNPRYENVLASAQDAVGFARGLQQAGYATDPHYATKLARIIKHSLSA
ncbi:flagellar assembly peptidoglycan hydrolase FlgJ [Noviherbaspirillum massiliense]|uniref:flagellar assembly peptidoglycan hydrolase FlgJ n=1 Tax=Noviherbaspirillum massiliense TaxID=1465823 RepID=UPI0003002387|nr:flagellar assembly peptidoglycan hydrolase FlgJ [Noviherbaspirillum massiliense]